MSQGQVKMPSYFLPSPNLTKYLIICKTKKKICGEPKTKVLDYSLKQRNQEWTN